MECEHPHGKHIVLILADDPNALWCLCGALYLRGEWHPPRNAGRMARLEKLYRLGKIVRAKWKSGMDYDCHQFAKALAAVGDCENELEAPARALAAAKDAVVETALEFVPLNESLIQAVQALRELQETQT